MKLAMFAPTTVVSGSSGDKHWLDNNCHGEIILRRLLTAIEVDSACSY